MDFAYRRNRVGRIHVTADLFPHHPVLLSDHHSEMFFRQPPHAAAVLLVQEMNMSADGSRLGEAESSKLVESLSEWLADNPVCGG